MQNYTASYLRQKRNRLFQQLKTIEPAILRGSLIEQYKRCGKSNCKCINGRGHGPKFYLSVSIARSRPVMVYVPLTYKEDVEKALTNHKKIKEIMEQISDINRELLRRKQQF